MLNLFLECNVLQSPSNPSLRNGIDYVSMWLAVNLNWFVVDLVLVGCFVCYIMKYVSTRISEIVKFDIVFNITEVHMQAALLIG